MDAADSTAPPEIPADAPRDGEFWYSERLAQAAVDFFHKYIRHTKGRWAGKPFIPAPWQEKDLRALFGWELARDYWFPNVRSMGGGIMLMGLVLYPYVYMLARAAFVKLLGSYTAAPMPSFTNGGQEALLQI